MFIFCELNVKLISALSHFWVLVVLVLHSNQQKGNTVDTTRESKIHLYNPNWEIMSLTALSYHHQHEDKIYIVFLWYFMELRTDVSPALG